MAVDELRERYEGRRDNGYVNLRTFDRGIKETLGGEIDPKGQHYVIPVERVYPDHNLTNTDLIQPYVAPRPGLTGVPIAFSYPEDVLQHFSLPYILVRRDDIAIAMNRWHPGMQQFRAPARKAQALSIGSKTGPDYTAQRQQAMPYDITYTIELYARNRGSENIENNLARLFGYVTRIFPAYGALYVTDSVGDRRSYEAFMESLSMIDDAPGNTDRIPGFAITVRVEAELDHLDIEEYPTARRVVLDTEQING